jgi:cell division protein ZapE
MLLKKKTNLLSKMSLSDIYASLCEEKKLESNFYQNELINQLQKISNTLSESRTFSLFSKKTIKEGLYIWGDVGRGKTMLMDLFFNNVQSTSKKRIHFHEFMKDVHLRLNQMTQTLEGSLPELIKQISQESRLLCLDEFQVTNISDAMLMSRLFEGLFKEGVILVATSNTSPLNLYENGLHRDRFLPFIPLLSEYTDVFHLKGEIDYRKEKLIGQKLYFSPCDETSMNHLRLIWNKLTDNAPMEMTEFEKEAPPLTLEGLSRGVAWAHFQDLCAKPCGRLSYLSLADSINTLILWGIPQMTLEDHNEAVRFTILIDILYDKGVWLAAAGDVEPEYLYQQGGSFDRTISRLYEMQNGNRIN